MVENTPLLICKIALKCRIIIFLKQKHKPTITFFAKMHKCIKKSVVNIYIPIFKMLYNKNLIVKNKDLCFHLKAGKSAKHVYVFKLKGLTCLNL